MFSGLFVSMPSRRTAAGKYYDIAHPVTTEARNILQATVLEAYEHTMANERRQEVGPAQQVTVIQPGSEPADQEYVAEQQGANPEEAAPEEAGQHVTVPQEQATVPHEPAAVSDEHAATGTDC